MTHTNALGLPVEGDIYKGHSTTKQRPIEELRPLIEAVFTHPDVEAVRWRQYTPYFMDGDECVFGVNCDYDFVRLVGMGDAEGEDESGFVGTDDARVKGGEHQKYIPGVYEYDRMTGHRVTVSEYRYESAGTFERSPAYADLLTLQSAVGSGEFDDALYELFGDHATVTVTQDKIIVERYEHD